MLHLVPTSITSSTTHCGRLTTTTAAVAAHSLFLGDFNVAVDPNTLKPVLNMLQDDNGNFTIPDITPNEDFGKKLQTFSQEGVDSRRTIRLRLRITF